MGFVTDSSPARVVKGQVGVVGVESLVQAGSGCEVERRGLAEVVVASRGFWTGKEPCPVGEMMRWRETLGNVTGGVSWMVGWPHAASAPTVSRDLAHVRSIWGR